MQCDRARELLSAYRDDELGPEERHAVVGHIEACKACDDALADNERIGRLLKRVGRTPSSPALASRVHAALKRADTDDFSTPLKRNSTMR